MIRTPLYSNVGIAKHVFQITIFDFQNIDTFFECSTDVELVFRNVSKLKIPTGMEGYLENNEVYGVSIGSRRQRSMWR